MSRCHSSSPLKTVLSLVYLIQVQMEALIARRPRCRQITFQAGSSGKMPSRVGVRVAAAPLNGLYVCVRAVDGEFSFYSDEIPESRLKSEANILIKNA